MVDAPQPSPPGPPDDDSKPNVAFLPIGLTFFVLGLTGLSNDSMRGTSSAFLPIGIVFILLSLRSRTRNPTGGAETPPEAEPPRPDVTPR